MNQSENKIVNEFSRSKSTCLHWNKNRRRRRSSLETRLCIPFQESENSFERAIFVTLRYLFALTSSA